jgi:hypothetical protein
MAETNISEFKLGPDWWTAKALGAVTSAWALLEMYIDVMIWSLAGLTPYTGACITSQLPNISRRLYALASLIEQRGPSSELRKKINQYIELSNKLARQRNRAIHDPWFHRGDINSPLAESHRLEITAEAKLTFKAKLVPTKELFNLAIKIEEHRGSLMHLTKQIDAELGTSLSTFANLIPHSGKDGNDHS